jgi:hypothetical protein
VTNHHVILAGSRAARGWWECRRRSMSNGERIAEIPPGLASAGILRVATNLLDVPAETSLVLAG